ncbi:RelA/SpoT domain-containing protein [Enhygromyxa salina]|uniref:RelA/SpoT domain-containing protein n=1 Tax=Enhygromyxa salina TaxID=215803 RepID=A0A2S9YUN2_9BACT|nr:RelA/SpoT domain-containing protein [Enhygromyxa salina]PRQ08794.1 hypothetical protein ENSA7_14260 [Enhygromyxa salina]
MSAEWQDSIIAEYIRQRPSIDVWHTAVRRTFEVAPELHLPPLPVIHSIKGRLKDPEHLRGKLSRKREEGEDVTKDTLFDQITDLAGVRVLHLHQTQFPAIHGMIDQKVQDGDWVLGEAAVAYSWDPDAQSFFEKFGLDVKIKESAYTSVHYQIRAPGGNRAMCCEVQVRTLFEEIWGEIDHSINYPTPAISKACQEQLRVLARLVSTGTRLVDSIFSTYVEHSELTRLQDLPD